MPRYKMRDMTEERKNNFIALRQEVKVPDLIAMLLRNADAKQASTLERTLSLYTCGQLRGRTRDRNLECSRDGAPAHLLTFA